MRSACDRSLKSDKEKRQVLEGQEKGHVRTRTRRPIGMGILPTAKSEFPTDALAGITLATLAIPEVMGYTRIAGTPVITGLFTILLPMALYAFFGSSRHLVVGADSATAAVLAAGLVGLAAVGSPEYVEYASVLALMVAVLLILARLVKLGFLADFLSRTVLVGFLAGVGIEIAIKQISDMLGLSGQGGEVIQELATDFQLISKTNVYALTISITLLAIIFGTKRISRRRIPVALFAIVAVIFVSYALNLSSHGVPVLGPIPSGLPQIAFPSPPMSLSIFQQLFPTAASMFVIIIAQSAATSRAYADRYNEDLDENLDLVGLGLANIGAALSGTFVVNGSPTKTEMVDSAGGRSQLAQLTTVTIVLAVLLFLTPPLSYMPIAVLATIVFIIGVELVDVKQMRQIFVQRPSEFWITVLTAGTVVFVGVEQGIVLAIVLSLFDHTRRGYRPKNIVLTLDQYGERQPRPVTSHAQLLPGLIVYRFNHSMYYANANLFSREALDLINEADPPVTWLCLDLAAVDDIDFSAAAAIRSVYNTLKQRNIRLVLAEVADNVGAELERYGITELIGIEGFFKTIIGVEVAFKRTIDNEVHSHEGS